MSTTGSTYGGRYAVIERVGSGGMAEVYRARDELLGREVALKVLHERFSRDRAFVERFRREAQAAANLNHPNVVSLFDYGSDEGTYFIVMEFIEGRSLADIIHAEGPLMAERAAEIASDVAAALDRAHAAGLVHRDIKPSNIMIASNGQTKVTDFGIARALSSEGEQTMTQTGMVIGTASYLSPEQAQGSPVDARSDVYSLGVVLYEMLAGRPPFTGDSPLSIAYKHVREDPAPPSTVNADVPQPLDAIAMKALAKNPDNRFASAAEMHDDLQRFLSGQQVLATPLLAAETAVAPAASSTQVLSQTELYEPAGEPEPRRALWYVAVALIALALVGVLAYFLYNQFINPAPPPKTVAVPSVVGLTLHKAQAKLDKKNLNSTVKHRKSSQPPDTVLNQKPAAGAKAHEGDTVTLIVSGGAGSVTVPDVSGEPLDQARQDIQNANLIVGQSTPEASETVSKGDVIRTIPGANRTVSANTSVDIIYSSGPQAVAVPNVVGKAQAEAEKELRAAGFTPSAAPQPSDTVPKGQVISQDPTAGSPQPPGTTVTIAVSTGPQARAMPDVRGENADSAQQQLEQDYGLTVTQTDYTGTNPCTVPPGDVCDQDPAPGSPVKAGDHATLFVQPGGAFVNNDLLFGWVTGFALLA